MGINYCDSHALLLSHPYPNPHIDADVLAHLDADTPSNAEHHLVLEPRPHLHSDTHFNACTDANTNSDVVVWHTHTHGHFKPQAKHDRGANDQPLCNRYTQRGSHTSRIPYSHVHGDTDPSSQPYADINTDSDPDVGS